MFMCQATSVNMSGLFVELPAMMRNGSSKRIIMVTPKLCSLWWWWEMDKACLLKRHLITQVLGHRRASDKAPSMFDYRHTQVSSTAVVVVDNKNRYLFVCLLKFQFDDD